TAQIVAVTLVIGYAWASLSAARPALAGLFLGLGLATRPPALGFMVPLFLWEAATVTGALSAVAARAAAGAGGGASRRRLRFRPNRALVGKLVRFSLPVAAVLAATSVLNWMRFRQPFEFGHRYLNVQWQDRIQR